jgi:integral membrane protein
MSRFPDALMRYRVMAYVVGVMLLLLVAVAMPLKYFAHNSGAVKVVGPLHGMLYVVYLLTTIQLAFSRRWPLLRTLLVMLGGVVPFLSFVTERRVVRDEQAAPVNA